VPSVLRNSLLYLPNYKTVYCALRITKQLLLTPEQLFVPFDLRKQFLDRCDFRKSLLRPPNHGTISRVSRIMTDRVLSAT